ncbi:MAG: ABC transporter permease [Spirochaetales bacterium]|nr:ABC transporter permease [Spirochaetales bacterium]
MRTLLLITANFLKLTLYKKINYLLYLAAPIASFLIVFLIFGTTSSGGVSVGYSNNDDGEIGAELIAYLQKTEKNKIIQVDEEELESRIIEGKIVMSLVIPENFSEKLLYGEHPEIRLSSLQGEGADVFIQGEINYFMNSLLKLKIAAGTDKKVFTEMYDEFLKSSNSIKIREVRDPGTQKIVGSMGLGFFLYILLMQATVITGLMLTEKQNRTFFRIRIAPVREVIYSLGNMLAAFIILGSQIVFTFFIILCIFRINLGLSLFAVIPLLLAFSIAAIGFGIMVTAIAGSTLQAALLSNLVIIITSILGGCFWPLSFMPDFLQYIAGIFPQSWTMRAIEKLQSGASLSSTGFTILLLISFGGLFISVYAYKMKHGKNIRTIT